MDIYFDANHLTMLAWLVVMAAYFLTGWRLARCIVWMAAWQLFTPERPFWLDAPLMLGGFALAEGFYGRLKG